MRLYRTIYLEQLEIQNGEFFVSPSEFVSNPDSTIESGVWSFWLDTPANFGHRHLVVSAEFEPKKKGVMTFDTTFAYDDESGIRTYYEIDEYVTDEVIKIDKIFVWNIKSIEFLFGKLHKDSFIKRRGVDFFNENISPIFPHLKEDERYYWGDGCGCKPDSFKEIISGTNFCFGGYDELTFNKYTPKYTLISCDLLGDLFAGYFGGGNVPHISDIATEIRTEDYYC